MKTCPQCKMRYPDDATSCVVEGSDLLSLPDPRIGTLLAGRYVIEEVIGEGGMATVYRARHRLVDRHVAVKVLTPMLAADDIVRERFRREARNAQKLAHPNIVEIYEQGETEDGTAYIVMELLRGESLANVIARGPLDVDRAIAIMVQIARGIARAHDLGIVHRDLKPENIFLCRRDDGSEVVKLLDFGIARSRHDSRLTGQGELFGTPQYMAPERIMGNDSGAPSDIYALGVVFFETTTGRLPFTAPDIATFFMKHMNEAPIHPRQANLSVPEALGALILKMLAKTPEERPVDAHRIHQDLLDILEEREMEAPPETVADPVFSPVALAPGAGDGWARRVAVFEQMLARAYGERGRAPSELGALLDEVSEKANRVVQLRAKGLQAQGALEDIETKGREKRTQLGRALDQLGVDGSKAKEDLRAARDATKRAHDATTAARARFEQAHREAMYWEGRSGMAEPWPDLSIAYRRAADAVDEWARVVSEERAAAAAADAAERLVDDVEFQIRELRTAIHKHEHDLDEQKTTRQDEIERHGTDADRLETELFELATRFCKPLRTRPELAPLFEELETESAADGRPRLH